MTRAFLILAALWGTLQPTEPAPSTVEWYGARIGDAIPPGPGEPADRVWPTPPAPWTEMTVEADKSDHIASIDLWDTRPAFESATRMRSSPDADMSAKYIADGIAVRDAAVLRLGKPSEIQEGQAGANSASLSWDFVPRFVRCDGEAPILASATTESSGRLAKVTLEYSPVQVHLTIWGTESQDTASYGPTAAEERERGLDQCKPKKEEDGTAEVVREMAEFCKDNPDKCITSVPGAIIIPEPGVTVVRAPCPIFSKHTACYHGKKIRPPARPKPTD